MSSIKARLMKPTGLEFHDTAFELDREIWNFIKNEYKNKSKNEHGELPVRYWQTHAVPLHRECWRLIAEITYANSIYPTNDEELQERKKHQQEAIGCCYNLFQLLRLMLNEIPSINADKLGPALALINKEADLLKAWKRASRITSPKPKSDTP